MRQAEGESSQSLLEVLQSQNTELQYQVREKDGRIAQLNEELSDSRQEQRFGVSDPSTSPEEVAKLLAAAESRHEAKLSALKQRLASMEAERVEVEAEWRQKVEAKLLEAQKWKSMVDTASQNQQDDDDRTQGLQVEVERLRLATRTHEYDVSQLKQEIERLTLDEVRFVCSRSDCRADHYIVQETSRQQLSEQVKRISTLDHQLEEITAKELQVRTHNKAWCHFLSADKLSHVGHHRPCARSCVRCSLQPHYWTVSGFLASATGAPPIPQISTLLYRLGHRALRDQSHLLPRAVLRM